MVKVFLLVSLKPGR